MGYTLQMGGGSYRIAGGDSLSSKIRQTPLEISDKCSIFVEQEGEFVVVTVNSITQEVVANIDQVYVYLSHTDGSLKERSWFGPSQYASLHTWGNCSPLMQKLSLKRNKYYFNIKDIPCSNQLKRVQLKYQQDGHTAFISVSACLATFYPRHFVLKGQEIDCGRAVDVNVKHLGEWSYKDITI
jgi:hypothetical protein